MELNPQWIVGFVDGEGCFHVSINHHPEMTNRYQVLPEFTVVQHISDVQILFALQQYFNCGVVRTNHGDRMAYRVRSLDQLLEVIIPFFEKNCLKTKKYEAFKKFKEIVELMRVKFHLTLNGIKMIEAIVSTMNRKQHTKHKPN